MPDLETLQSWIAAFERMINTITLDEKRSDA